MPTGTAAPKQRAQKRSRSTERNGNGKTAAQAPEDPNRRVVINTLAPPRAYAEIDDQRHNYRLLQDFGAIERHEFSRQVGELRELQGSEKKLTPAQCNRFDELLDGLLDTILVHPEKLRDQLSEVNPETGEPRLTGTVKELVINAFFNTPEARMMEAQAMEQLVRALAETEAEAEAQNSSTSTS